MAVRASMTKIIALLRQFGHAAEDEITLGAVTYWTDEQLQDIADRNKYVTVVPLVPKQVVGRTIFRLDMPKSYYAEDDTFTIYNSSKIVDGTSYVHDFNAGLLTFSSDLSTSYKFYAECQVTNLNSALAELWGLKAAQRFDYITFSGGDNTMSHEQEHKQCLAMLKHYRDLTITRLPRGKTAKWSIS